METIGDLPRLRPAFATTDDLGFGMLLEPIRCSRRGAIRRYVITPPFQPLVRLRACSHNTTERLAGDDAWASIRSLKRSPMSFRRHVYVLAKLPITPANRINDIVARTGKPINSRPLNQRPRPSRRQRAAEYLRFPRRRGVINLV